MQKNLDHSTTIDEDEKLKVSTAKAALDSSVSIVSDDDETARVAREIVAGVINKVVEDLRAGCDIQPAAHDDPHHRLTQTSSNLSTYDDCCESLTNQTNLSLPAAETQSSIDDVYHDIETDYSNDTLNDLIERAETKTRLAPNTIGPKPKNISDHELIDSFSLQMHRIDKDVTRCDRNYPYFVSNENLKKLKNIMYT